MMHTVWALATGIVVVIVARERYSYIPWVLAFLGITWLSTMFFGGRPGEAGPPGDPAEAGPRDDPDHASGERPPPDLSTPSLGTELTSYVTRILYQETLFFMLPFYAYSTVRESPNVVFLGVLGMLALLSCLDLLFDRWLRTSPVFGLVFFAGVAFAAVNLILPMVTRIDPETASPVAAAVAVASSIPIALRGARTWGQRARLALVAGVLLIVPVVVPELIPPVPLRMREATFAQNIDKATLALSDTVWSGVPADEMTGAMIVLVEVYAPTSVPASVYLEWFHDGVPFRTSDEVEILAHEGGFRVWDSWRPDPPDRIEPGRYEVTLKTHGGRVFGVTTLDVAAPERASAQRGTPPRPSIARRPA